MGRSGGGGSRGGGRSGGSRSSGRSARSSSSSSRSSGRSSYSSRGSYSSKGGLGGGFGFGPSRGYSAHRPINIGPTIRNTNVFVNKGGGYSSGGSALSDGPMASGNSSGKSGLGSTILMVSIWVIIILVLFALFSGDSGSGGGYDDITDSTIQREKLHLNLSDEAGYFTDECDWIRNRTTLEKGLKDFYGSTGILPYVYIIDNVAGDYDPSTEKLEQFAETSYEELFDDEGHALLVFWDYDGAYEYTLWLGADAAELMDTEACDILFDYLDYYYDEADTEDEFFADAFSDAGERMMSISRSPVYYIVIVLAVGAGAFAVYWIWKSRRDKEAARKKRAEEILNTPLKKFSDGGDMIDELEKKYEKEI